MAVRTVLYVVGLVYCDVELLERKGRGTAKESYFVSLPVLSMMSCLNFSFLPL